MSERLTRDIVVTWPKTRPLESYLAELGRAERQGLVVCFRVPTLPKFAEGAFDYGAPQVRCYRVHDGQIRGYLRLLLPEFRGHREVMRVESDLQVGDYWARGNYLVCDPEWHPLHPNLPMRGFRGWRWLERP